MRGNARTAETPQTGAQQYLDGRWYVAGYRDEQFEREGFGPYRYEQFAQYIAETNRFYGESDEYGGCDDYSPESADVWVLQS